MKKTIFSIALAVSVNFSASAAHAYDWDMFSYFNNTVSFMNDSAGEDGWSRNGFRDDPNGPLRDVVTNNNTGAQTEFWYDRNSGAAAGAIISNNGTHSQYDACGKQMSWWSDDGQSESFETDCAY